MSNAKYIALNFGKQFPGAMCDEIQEWAIKYDLSIEDATINCYKYMTWSLVDVNNNWQSHFDIMFSNIYKCLVVAPDVIFDATDLNGFKTPTLLLKSNYVTERYTKVKHHIGADIINTFGQAFQDEFGLEYLGFELSCKKQHLSTNLTKNDHRSRPRNSVIYLISDKPHYYDGKRFLPIISTSTFNRIH
jgi:hypothetical protein